LVDTGSSNTWVGAKKSYVRTASSVSIDQTVNVTYGFGSFSGSAFNDTVTLSPDIVITNQTIGSAITSNAFANLNVDGILGLGPPGLSIGKFSPDAKFAPPTILDSFITESRTLQPVLGLGLVPTEVKRQQWSSHFGRSRH